MLWNYFSVECHCMQNYLQECQYLEVNDMKTKNLCWNVMIAVFFLMSRIQPSSTMSHFEKWNLNEFLKKKIVSHSWKHHQIKPCTSCVITGPMMSRAQILSLKNGFSGPHTAASLGRCDGAQPWRISWFRNWKELYQPDYNPARQTWESSLLIALPVAITELRDQ